MSLNLKIKVPALNTTKVMRFPENLSVSETCKQIQEKVGVGGKDHGLFEPNPNFVGRWLRYDRTLEFYGLQTNDLVEYKKKHEALKIRLVDETIKTILVDISLTVKEMTAFICEKIGIKNTDEYSLQDPAHEGQWLKDGTALTEQVQSLEQTFLLKKKFFMSDANVNQDDPVQLHLVYCQSRDDILHGRHPCTKDEAVNFACLQLQIQFGNFNPDNHKPGVMRLEDILPQMWRNKECEKRVLDEWKKLVGMTDMNARFRYVQLCRSLSTYGMTCFQVKERVPGKKKLMDALLCFTRDKILRMEAESKRIIKEYSFKHLLRWAASPETFTLDFGAYEEEYVVVLTQEGEAISALIAGYIDLLLKKQRDATVPVDDDDNNVAEVTSVARVGGVATATTSGAAGGSTFSYAQGINDCAGASRAIDRMLAEMFGQVAKMDAGNLTPAQRRQQLLDHVKALQGLSEIIQNMAQSGDRGAMTNAALKIAQATEQLISCARQAAASGADPDGLLMNASKLVSEALKNLISASQDAANKPNDQNAREALLRAQQAAAAALQKLLAASRGIYAEEGFQELFKELARAVTVEAEDLLARSSQAEATVRDPTKRQALTAASESLSGATDHMAKICNILAATAQDSQCRSTIEQTGKGLEKSAANLVAIARTAGTDPSLHNQMIETQKRIQRALQNLIGLSDLPDTKGAKEASEFTESAQAILQSTSALMAAQGNAELIKQQSTALRIAVTKLGTSGRAIIAQQTPAAKERMANYLKATVEATKNAIGVVPTCVSNPQDKAAHKQLSEHCGEIAENTRQLLSDAGRQVALAALYDSAKMAAAQTTKLCTSARTANGWMQNAASSEELANASKAAADSVQKLINALRDAGPLPVSTNKRSSTLARSRADSSLSLKEDVMTACEQFAPVAYKLVSTAKTTSANVANPDAKADLVFSSTNAAKAIHQMLANRKALKAVKGQLETGEAMQEFSAAEADLEAALIAADTGILQTNKTKDEALQELALAIGNLGNNSKKLMQTSKQDPENVGPVMKTTAAAVTQAVRAATNLAAAIPDKSIQRAILNTLSDVTKNMKNLMQFAKAVSGSPEDPNLNKLMIDSGKSVADSLMRLTEASRGIMPKKVEEFHQKASNEIEDLAEKELRGAAAAIEKCVQKLTEATASARQRMTEKGISIDEQNITEAILEASKAIASATAVLVNAATSVQQEFGKLLKDATTRSSYSRDPQFAEGLISAARTVAGTVQHLVQCANNAAQGNASEESLIVSAQAVSAATTQLVMASTVKSGPNSASHAKLNDAAKSVSSATQMLVNAAKHAAEFEKEQSEAAEDNKYSLTNAKILEMEQQMAILKMEKELDTARAKLGNMRKGEYTKNVNQDYKPNIQWQTGGGKK